MLHLTPELTPLGRTMRRSWDLCLLVSLTTPVQIIAKRKACLAILDAILSHGMVAMSGGPVSRSHTRYDTKHRCYLRSIRKLARSAFEFTFASFSSWQQFAFALSLLSTRAMKWIESQGCCTRVIQAPSSKGTRCVGHGVWCSDVSAYKADKIPQPLVDKKKGNFWWRSLLLSYIFRLRHVICLSFEF